MSRSKKQGSDASEESRREGSKRRKKGHNGEVRMARMFREQTIFKNCKTTRVASRLLDNCSIDLAYIPVRVQVKTGAHKGMNVAAELEKVRVQCNLQLPEDAPEQKQPVVLIHLRSGPSGKKKSPYLSLATMTVEDFIQLFNLAYPDNKNKMP